jgi:hypothetical protein
MSLDDKLFLAPIDTDKMQRVLDIGTGTGICTDPRCEARPRPMLDYQMLTGLWRTREHGHG